jgi:hypothetical protein
VIDYSDKKFEALKNRVLFDPDFCTDVIYQIDKKRFYLNDREKAQAGAFLPSRHDGILCTRTLKCKEQCRYRENRKMPVGAALAAIKPWSRLKPLPQTIMWRIA